MAAVVGVLVEMGEWRSLAGTGVGVAAWPAVIGLGGEWVNGCRW